MLNSILQEQPAGSKLALCLLAGGLISAGAAAVCWLCGLDPAGGASLSADTLRAAAVGGAAAAPLVALKAVLWSEAARRELPFLEDIHKAQVGAAAGSVEAGAACSGTSCLWRSCSTRLISIMLFVSLFHFLSPRWTRSSRCWPT